MKFSKLIAITLLVGLPLTTLGIAPQEADKDLWGKAEKATNRAIAFLRQRQTPEGAWHHAGQTPNAPLTNETIGTTALCTLALVEIGLDTDDPAVAKAVALLRGRIKHLDSTFAIAMSVYVLERVRRSEKPNADVQMLAEKLLRGQHKSGGWSAHCPARPGEQEDVSSSGYAVLGLWIARRNEVQVTPQLQLAEKRFRETQRADGGWDAHFNLAPKGQSQPATTCAGMLALAFGFGSRHKPEDTQADRPQKPRPDLKADPQVIRARDYVSKHVGQPLPPGQANLFFLWFLERVCLVYRYTDLKGVDFDWYIWGAKYLLGSQNKDGSWAGTADTGPHFGTGLAILYLSKSHMLGLEEVIHICTFPTMTTLRLKK